MYTLHCTVYSVQCTLYMAHYYCDSVQCTLRLYNNDDICIYELKYGYLS